MRHPLDQISAEEINTAVDICKSCKDFDEDAVFINISLVEPEKEFVRTYKKGEEFPRLLKIRGIDSNTDGGFVAIADMRANKISSLTRVSNESQVSYSLAEIFMAQELTKANKDYQEALKKRGVSNLDLIQIISY